MSIQISQSSFSLSNLSSLSSSVTSAANAFGRSVLDSTHKKISKITVFLSPKKIDDTTLDHWRSLTQQCTNIGTKAKAVKATPSNPNNIAAFYLDQSGVANLNPSINPPKVVTLMLPGPGGILLTRPVKELVSHIFDHKLPSFQLIARAIKVLVLGIFRWHLCDNVILYTFQGYVHSMNGKFTTHVFYNQLKDLFPYRFENAIWLKLTDGLLKKYDPAGKHPFKDSDWPDSIIRCPDFKGYKEINAQTTCEYYKNFFGIDITTKTTGNTISDLVKSKALTTAKS